MDVREKLVKICFREFCDLAGDSPCGCDGCPYGEYEPDNGGCYVEYKKDKIEKLENDMDKYQKEDNDVTVQEWISVNDRLPESGVHVLICCEMHRYGGEIAGKYVCDGYYAEANKIRAECFADECNYEYSEEDDECYLCEGWYEVVKNWDDYNSVAVEDFVTHWMPLPKPPKGE